MAPTMAAAARSAATICLAMRSLRRDVCDQDEQHGRDRQAGRDAKGVAAKFRSHGGGECAPHTIATSGSVIGVRHANAAGTRTHAAAAAASAITIASSTVVSVKPKIEPGTARSKGDTATTSITLAGTAHEPASARVSDTRGKGIATTSAKGGCRSAIQVPGIVGAFAGVAWA